MQVLELLPYICRCARTCFVECQQVYRFGLHQTQNHKLDLPRPPVERNKVFSQCGGNCSNIDGIIVLMRSLMVFMRRLFMERKRSMSADIEGNRARTFHRHYPSAVQMR